MKFNVLEELSGKVVSIDGGGAVLRLSDGRLATPVNAGVLPMYTRVLCEVVRPSFGKRRAEVFVTSIAYGA